MYGGLEWREKGSRMVREVRARMVRMVREGLRSKGKGGRRVSKGLEKCG